MIETPGQKQKFYKFRCHNTAYIKKAIDSKKGFSCPLIFSFFLIYKVGAVWRIPWVTNMQYGG